MGDRYCQEPRVGARLPLKHTAAGRGTTRAVAPGLARPGLWRVRAVCGAHERPRLASGVGATNRLGAFGDTCSCEPQRSCVVC